MISLDRKILDPNSDAARRMVEYGRTDELFIIIPNREMEAFDLSSTVHVQSTGGNKLLQFCRLRKIGNKLIKNNNIQEITTQDPFFTGLVGWCLKKKFNLKLEVQMHGDFFNSYYQKQWIKLKIAKFVLKRADVIRVVGERVKHSLLDLGIRESKIILKSVPIDVEFIKNYQPKIDLHQKYPGYEKIFLVLGRLEQVKNIKWLVELFKEIIKQRNNYLLLIVGGGAEEPNIKYQISNNKLKKNVILENWTDNPFDYLKTADCLLFPSLNEGYGLVAMEAFAAGTPVIMTDVGVANYELKPGPKVIIAPAGDKKEFLKAILEI